MSNTHLINNDIVLKEIFPLPSKKIIAGRFSSGAKCTGDCENNGCRECNAESACGQA